jgi:hypothetical protein
MKRHLVAVFGITVTILIAIVAFPGPLFWGPLMAPKANAEMEVVDPYAPRGWCDVEAVNEDVIWNPRTCEAWIIRCPTTGGSCKAWPVQMMETPEPGPEKADGKQ